MSLPSVHPQLAVTEVRRGVVCLGCGCLCDDLQVELAGDQIKSIQPACPGGLAWLTQPLPTAETVCRIEGEPASLATGMNAAAQLLQASRAPLVCGLSHSSTAGQRAAVALADRLGAVVDTWSTSGHLNAQAALADGGLCTATLGEVRHRADQIVVWQADPVRTQRRHFERYSLNSKGRFLPGGRADRKLWVLSSSPSATSEQADAVWQFRPGADFAVLNVLQALAAQVELCPATVLAQTGLPLSRWSELNTHLQSAQYGTFLFDHQLSAGPGGRQRALGLFQLVRLLQRKTRWIAVGLGAAGNPVGAENVLAWRTGFPAAVDLAQGVPHSFAGQFAAPRKWSRGEVDTVLAVGLDESVVANLPTVPLIWLGATPPSSKIQPAVQFVTGKLGLQTAGTVYRVDDVALRTTPLFPSTLPTDAEVLSQLLARIEANRLEANPPFVR